MKKQQDYLGFLTLTAGLIASCSSSDNPTPTATLHLLDVRCYQFSRRHKQGEVTLDPKTYKIN
jgi:hypothetical protein